jgi:hypothetical protein
MLTAVLPIRMNKNSFWSSSQGLVCINDFLGTCKQISEIDRFIVNTQDDSVCSVADKYNMKIERHIIPGSIDRPYTFEQSQAIAANFEKYCTKNTDALIILDHRNLFLTTEDFLKAISLYQQNSESGIISLAFCWDYPCQYKSFYNFLDCLIVNFDKDNKIDNVLKPSSLYISKDVKCNVSNYDKISICISGKLPKCKIAFSNKNQNHYDYLAQIIPFDSNGPLYDQSKEFHIQTCEYETLLENIKIMITGVIIILTQPSQSGQYNSVEIFTPENAPWELSGKGSFVIDIKKQEPMYGRQQFPLVYTYDGSLCVLSKSQLKEKSGLNPIPLILKRSHIVNDLVDYCYFATDQILEETLRN